MKTIGIILTAIGLSIGALTLYQGIHGRPTVARGAVIIGHQTPLGGPWDWNNGFNIPAGGAAMCDLASLWREAQILLGPPVSVFDGSEQSFQYYRIRCRPGQPPLVLSLGLLDLIAQGKQPVPNPETAAVAQEHIITAIERGVDPTTWFGKPLSSPQCAKGTCRQWYEKTALTWPAQATSGEQVAHEPLGCRQVPDCLAVLTKQSQRERDGVNWLLLGGAAAALITGAVLLLRARSAFGFGWDS